MGGLASFLGFRVAQSVVTFIGIVIIIFFLVRVVPGDPARLLAGPEAEPEDVELLRKQLGLDRPLYEQFWIYISSLVRGDLGRSFKTNEPVINEIMARLPYTIQLALVSEGIALSLGILIGVVAGLRPRSAVGYLASVLGIIGSSFPVFWTALLLIWIFAVELKLLPSSGAGTPAHIVLPAFTIALLLMGNIVRLVKSSVAEAYSSNFVVTAMAKGLKWNLVVVRHILKPALIPVVTIAGLQFGQLMGGAIITETVFGWPGIGRLLVDSIFMKDFMMTQGVVIVFAAIFLGVMIMVEVIQSILDPRIRR